MQSADHTFYLFLPAAGKKRKAAPKSSRRSVASSAPFRKRGKGGIALSDDEEAAAAGPRQGGEEPDEESGDAAETRGVDDEPATAPAQDEAPKPKSKVILSSRYAPIAIHVHYIQAKHISERFVMTPTVLDSQDGSVDHIGD